MATVLIICIHQLHDHLMSLRVQLSLLVVLAFFGVNGTIYAWRMEKLPEIDAGIRADIEDRYENSGTVRGAAGNRFRIQNEATGTEFMVEGGFDWFWGGSGSPPGPATTRSGS